MTEGDQLPEEYLIKEASGIRYLKTMQEANLTFWDKFIEDVGQRMEKEVPVYLAEIKKHDEYQQRTNKQIQDL